jgi:hypothetical protein
MLAQEKKPCEGMYHLVMVFGKVKMQEKHGSIKV